MGIEEPNKLDILGKHKNGNPFIGIFDAGVTTDEKTRFLLLAQKLKNYLKYLLTEQYKSSYPKNKPEDFDILVYCKNEPTEDMKKLISIKGKLENKEIEIPVSFEIHKE